MPNTDHANHNIDALLPAEIAEKAEEVGVHKAQLDVLSLVALAILAGAFIALGSMFATTVLAGTDGVIPFGVSRLLAGIVFGLGLILVVLGGAELFTGNNLMVMAWAAGKLPLRDMLRAWAKGRAVLSDAILSATAATAPRPARYWPDRNTSSAVPTAPMKLPI